MKFDPGTVNHSFILRRERERESGGAEQGNNRRKVKNRGSDKKNWLKQRMGGDIEEEKDKKNKKQVWDLLL